MLNVFHICAFKSLKTCFGKEMLTALLCGTTVIPVEPTSIPLFLNLNGIADIIVVALQCL